MSMYQLRVEHPGTLQDVIDASVDLGLWFSKGRPDGVSDGCAYYGVENDRTACIIYPAAEYEVALFLAALAMEETSLSLCKYQVVEMVNPEVRKGCAEGTA